MKAVKISIQIISCIGNIIIYHFVIRWKSFDDLSVVTGALKCYLRELPEPLMTFELYNDWFNAAGCVFYLNSKWFSFSPWFCLSPELDLCRHREKDQAEKVEQFRVLLKKLPPENYNNLRCGLITDYRVSPASSIVTPSCVTISYLCLSGTWCSSCLCCLSSRL